jgi:hypothetical protein
MMADVRSLDWELYHRKVSQLISSSNFVLVVEIFIHAWCSCFYIQTTLCKPRHETGYMFTGSTLCKSFRTYVDTVHVPMFTQTTSRNKVHVYRICIVRVTPYICRYCTCTHVCLTSQTHKHGPIHSMYWQYMGSFIIKIIFTKTIKHKFSLLLLYTFIFKKPLIFQLFSEKPVMKIFVNPL